jgi:2-haloacid dehalogenase
MPLSGIVLQGWGKAELLTRISAVVFDIGNVLIEWNPRHLYRKIFVDRDGMPDDAQVERFLSTICTQQWNEKQDAGRSLEAGTAELLARHPDHAAAIRAFYGRFQEMMPGEIPGSVGILKALKARRCPVFGLSNFTRETFAPTRARFSFLGLLGGIVVSGEEGVMKPAPEIYRILASRYDLQPGSTLFIDDTAANISAAESLGFHGHHFRDAAGLAARLSTLKLL